MKLYTYYLGTFKCHSPIKSIYIARSYTFLNHFPLVPALCLTRAHHVFVNRCLKRKGNHNVGAQNHSVVRKGVLFSHKKE